MSVALSTLPMKGQNLVQVTVQGCTVNSSTGVLTPAGSAVTITTSLESLNPQWQYETEEINGMNSTRQNMVVLSSGMSVELEVFLVNNSTDPSGLRALQQQYDYIQFTWTQFTTVATMQAVRTGYQERFSGRGKQVATLSLGPIDIGANQVSYS